ncbi:hypothetical protein [Rhizobium laguerreae]|uniref:hypothetical protein n=1 Tax=Rhizobium laguerreae TaxID=1076926 RepID=UPI001C90049B|nr:hypothetical protein [Rhizobium laguerreae]MBY3314747.1 hypothetical protein [Rhizobium laguerreae]
MIKKIGIWVAIVAACGIAWATQKVFAIPDQTMWIALILIVLGIFGFQVEGRLQAIEERVIRKDYSGILKQLDGDRHVPQHKQPESLVAGGAIASWINPAHEILFDDFRWFGAVMNQHLPDAWAIEELPKTDLRGYEGPEFGRKYRVWYNACEIGTMQVSLGVGGLLKRDKFAENRAARVELDLEYLRFISYRDARGLLYEVALLVGSFAKDDGETSRSKAQAIASDALGAHLWETVRHPEFDPSFEFQVDGPYDLLREIVDHWKAGGIDPMKKWNGDREPA